MPVNRQVWVKLLEDVTMSPLVMGIYDQIKHEWSDMGEYESISIDCTFLRGVTPNHP